MNILDRFSLEGKVALVTGASYGIGFAIATAYASPGIETWAKKGLVNVLQYDLRDYGFFKWMKLGREMDRYGVLSAPHNYGGFYGNYAQLHFSASIEKFAFAEWDQAQAEGVDTSAYRIENGKVLVAPEAGFGLKVNDSVFDGLCEAKGWKITG